MIRRSVSSVFIVGMLSPIAPLIRSRVLCLVKFLAFHIVRVFHLVYKPGEALIADEVY